MYYICAAYMYSEGETYTVCHKLEPAVCPLIVILIRILFTWIMT